MPHKTVPFNEKLRLAALKEYAILNSGPDQDYDSLTFLAAKLCNAPVSKISIVDSERIWNKSTYGAQISEIYRKNSFCDYAIHSDKDIVILKKSQNKGIFDRAKGIYDREFSFYAGVPLHSHQGHAIGVLCVFDTEERDIDENQKKGLKALADQTLNLFEFRKQKRKLYKVQNKLKEKYGELEKFSSLVSHDIKSPLANIISLSELLREENRGKFDEDSEQYLEFLVDASYTLRNYVDGILGFYRSDHVLERDHENVNLKKLLKGIADLFQVADDIEINYPDDVMLHNVNKAALTQIFMNLIGNALKYNDKETRIVNVEFSKDAEFYNFKVTDNGMGIPQEKFDQIFELFSTLDNTDRDGNVGSGIGLATVKKLVESLDGSISIESNPGKGSSFNFSIRRI
ncbi:GAF domain-containing sensor histidine kinase [Gramella sp. AN32]|uniref:histidine kinase n=1 Tax=Christiangramia antarctica TaxID=2058158 RepID=A0ABW5X9U4_9FLAO|nr:GAF domain-containing sensor histidine kinase [Gramella sp. AN32]MCM4157434.1 histidine kinase [Gramella sp. AN32]